MSQRSSDGRPVTIQTSVLNVPPVPGPPVSSLAVDSRLVPVGTSRTTIGWATDTPDVAPRLAPAAPPARATLDDSPSLAAPAESRPAPMTSASRPLRCASLESSPPLRPWIASRCQQAVLRSLPIGKKRTRPIRQTSRAASRRASSPWCANTRARSSGLTSVPPRRSIHPSTIAGSGNRSRVSSHSGFSWALATCPFPHRDTTPTRGVLAIRRTGPKLARESSDTRIECGSST